MDPGGGRPDDPRGVACTVANALGCGVAVVDANDLGRVEICGASPFIDHDLLVAVRGGGHSLPGYSVCEGGIMIDLAPMQGVRVDAKTRAVHAEPATGSPLSPER